MYRGCGGREARRGGAGVGVEVGYRDRGADDGRRGAGVRGWVGVRGDELLGERVGAELLVLAAAASPAEVEGQEAAEEEDDDYGREGRGEGVGARRVRWDGTGLGSEGGWAVPGNVGACYCGGDGAAGGGCVG